MSQAEKPFTTDVPPVNPEGLIEDITNNAVEEVLGKIQSILYIGNREIRAYIVDDLRVYMWSDARGCENTIFISQEYVGKNHQVHWYKNRKLAAQNIMKVPNQRDFIERCVLKQVVPESLI